LALKLRVLLVNLQNFIRSFSGKHDSPQVNEHGQTHGVYELKLFFVFRVGGLESVKKDGVPDEKRVFKAELPGMEASNPPQKKGFGLDILKFHNFEEFKISRLQFLILNLNYPLKNRRIVLGIRVD
jgi:hypothetical protein